MRFLLAFLVTAAVPGDVYKHALLDASRQHSVHYVSTSTISGAKEVMVGDALADRGIQRITFTKGGATGHVVVVVANHAAYVRGDAFALREYMGLSAAQAAKFTGKWFVLKPPAGAYRVVAEAVTFPSFVLELAMPGPYTSVPHGVRSSVTRGGKTATVTLYVTPGSAPLPAKQVASGPTGTVTTVMGRWNEQVSVVAPPGAIPFS
ncbi:MAG TPA: hypothetical protein VI408_01345 [Gaiellaceae bacterium]